MEFGDTIATACATFAVTNIDDIFVLVTFFAEASMSRTLTPLKIVIGQYVGFSIIILVSMVGYAVALVLPSEPIGFLGLLPILLGTWKGFDLMLPSAEEKEEESEKNSIGTVRSVLKVSTVTLMNGGDNIGTYIPLFSQAKGAEIAVYIIVYYLLLGIWCLAAFLFMKEKHILAMAQRHAMFVVPFLYLGLGVCIIVSSSCYPWSIEQIDGSTSGISGRVVMAATTTIVLLACVALMVWWKLKRKPQPTRSDSQSGSISHAAEAESDIEDIVRPEMNPKSTRISLHTSS